MRKANEFHLPTKKKKKGHAKQCTQLGSCSRSFLPWFCYKNSPDVKYIESISYKTAKAFFVATII